MIGSKMSDVNVLKVHADYIPKLGFFSPKIFGVKRGAENAPMQVI